MNVTPTYGEIRNEFKERYPELDLIVDDYRQYGHLKIRLWLKTGSSIGYDYETKKTFEITTDQ